MKEMPAEIKFLIELGKGIGTGAAIGTVIGVTSGLITVAVSALMSE